MAILDKLNETVYEFGNYSEIITLGKASEPNLKGSGRYNCQRRIVMASLQIPNHLEEELQLAADCSGRSKEELAAEILAAHFEDESIPLSSLTEAQLTRLKESIEQVKRGELHPESEMDSFFEEWFRELEAR